MGNFSWCYCDTGKIKRDPDGYAMPAHNQRLCICSMSHPASVLFPAEFGGKKAQINVPMYMNYGVFNGVDVYDLAADWNRRWASENPGFIMPSEKRFAERCRRRRDSEMSNYPGLTPEEVETEIAKGWSSFRCTPRRLSDFSWWPFYSDLSLSREELEIKWNESLPEGSGRQEYRYIGIDLAGLDIDNEAVPYPIKIAKNRASIYEECPPSLRDPLQGCD